MKHLLFLSAAGIMGACSAQNSQQQLHLQLLDASLQQANVRAIQANAADLRQLNQAVARAARFSRPGQQRVLARLVTRGDSLIAQAESIAQWLEAGRQRVNASLATSLPDTPYVGKEANGLAHQAVARMLDYRASLRRADATLLLPRLPRQLGVDTTTTALAATYFGQADKAGCAASLTHLEALVLADAATALRAQSTRLAIEDVIFDEYGAFAAAESNTVKAGEVYRADLFLTRVLKLSEPLRMTVNGQPLQIDTYGRGKVSFKADPALLGRRQRSTAFWQGAITTRYRGRDTTFTVHVPYTITR